MPTIRDVAAKAGVSRSTVSRCISGVGYVSPEARQRIDAVVEELGYVPNAMARGLKTQRSGLVALLVPEIVNSFYTTIFRGVEDVANSHDLQVILGNTDENPKKEWSYAELIVASQVEGVIVAPTGPSAKTLRLFSMKRVPTVLIDRTVEGCDADVVRSDSVGGTLDLTQHLIDLGHRRIALLNGDLATSTGREREHGYRLALTSAGIEFDPALVSTGSWFIESAEARMQELLDSAGSFTAIVATNNFMAIGALRALRGRLIEVPDRMALVCFDDIEQAAEVDPFITVMAQPAYTMGTIAMERLLERMDGRYSGPPREIVLSSRLVVRRSSGSGTALGLPGRSEAFTP